MLVSVDTVIAAKHQRSRIDGKQGSRNSLFAKKT
jgi:hypothetical protein